MLKATQDHLFASIRSKHELTAAVESLRSKLNASTLAVQKAQRAEKGAQWLESQYHSKYSKLDDEIHALTDALQQKQAEFDDYQADSSDALASALIEKNVHAPRSAELLTENTVMHGRLAEQEATLQELAVGKFHP